MRTWCRAGWHHAPRCSPRSFFTFSYLHPKHLWRPHCVTEVCRSTHRFLSWRQKRGEMFTETVGYTQAVSRVARRHYLPSLVIALAFALTIYPNKAQAQLVGDLVVNIPFQFHAGNAKLPAGEYRIHVLDDSNPTVMEITSSDGSTSALFQVRDTDVNATPGKDELVFNKYGNRYFLAKLFQEGSDQGRQVIASNYEKTVSQEATETQEHVPARRQGQPGS